MRNIGVMGGKELSSTKATNNWKGYQNKNLNNAAGITRKGNVVDAQMHYIEYTPMHGPIETPYTQTLEHLIFWG